MYHINTKLKYTHYNIANKHKWENARNYENVDVEEIVSAHIIYKYASYIFTYVQVYYILYVTMGPFSRAIPRVGTRVGNGNFYGPTKSGRIGGSTARVSEQVRFVFHLYNANL